MTEIEDLQNLPLIDKMSFAKRDAWLNIYNDFIESKYGNRQTETEDEEDIEKTYEEIE